jgi:drug/metabolite transporter superfamily protein YnfA
MGLEAVWQQGVYTCYQVWVWLRYQASVHPFLFLGALVVIVSAWLLYKAEAKIK